MTPEIEVLDQLEGGDLPLSEVVSLFPNEEDARRAIVAMVAAGELRLLDVKGVALLPWQLRELERQPGPWRADTRHRVSITDAGSHRFGA